jgi:hypothetical protein
VSPFARLRTVRLVLAAGVTIRALAWGVVASLTLLLAAAAVDSYAPLALATRHILQLLALGAGLATFAALVWRDRSVWTLQRVALWLEERDLSLAYTVVTAVETSDATLVRSAHAAWTRTAQRRAVRAPLVPVVATIISLLVLLLLPAGAVARIRSPHPGDSIRGPGGDRRDESRSRLSPLVARIEPPAYTHVRASSIDDPTEIRPVAGSVVTFSGRGDAQGIVARVNGESFAASARGDEWSIRMVAGARPAAVRLTDRSFERLVVINALVDAPPILTLRSPAKDSVLRVATGRLALSADATDDFGLVSTSFEYIISSGEGETFKFRSGTINGAPITAPSATHASLTATLPLDALKLVPGDIVHIRAVARDANNVSGPGIGTSETRALRIARTGEYDSLAVEAAAPTEEAKNVVSQRMLIILAEALARRTRLTRDSMVAESRSIAADQKRLRRTVGDVVFMRLGGNQSAEEHTDEDSPTRAKTMQGLLARADSATNRSTDPIDFQGGESPVVAVNKPLLEAYNAMWDASTQLEIGEPAAALPHMRRALAAIEKARQAERLYLRGRPPQVVIDIDKARLKGKDKGSSATRLPLPASDSITRSLESRLVRAIELSSRTAAAAIDSLTVLRIDALTDNPGFAATLLPAIDAMRRGRGADATTALARARRFLAGPPIVRDSIARWGGIP